MFPTRKPQAWAIFQRTYEPGGDYATSKKSFDDEARKLSIPGCTGCALKSAFREFMNLADRLTKQELLSFEPDFIMAKKNTATPTPTPTLKKAVAKKKAKKLTPTAPVVEAKYPGGLKFLYIPTKK